MSFVYPAGLWALLALGVFAAVCLIRHRSEVTPVSSTYLWRLSEQRRKKKGYWRTLKRSLFFALQFLALALSALLIAQPIMPMPGSGVNIAVILDASASMQMADGSGQTRFARAVAAAERDTDRLPWGASVTVVLAGDEARVAADHVSGGAELRAALEGVSCGWGAGDVAGAAALCQQMLDEGGISDVRLYTDAPYAQAEGLEVISLRGGDEWNVSLGALETSGSIYGTAFETTVQSFGRSADVSFELIVDGKARGAEEIELRVNGQKQTAQTVYCPEGEAQSVSLLLRQVYDFTDVSVRVCAEDGMAQDNAVQLSRQAACPARVLLVGENPYFWQKALEAFPRVELTTAEDWRDATLEAYDVYAFDGCLPEKLPQDGAVWLLNPPRSPREVGVVLGERLMGAYVKGARTDTELGERLTRGLVLRDAAVARFREMTAQGGLENVLLCGEMPVMAAGTNANGCLQAVLPFDIQESNLPLLPDFVVLVNNMLEASAPTLLDAETVDCGTRVYPQPHPLCSRLFLQTPDMRLEALDPARAADGVRVDSPGSYTLMQEVRGQQQVVRFAAQVPQAERTTQTQPVDQPLTLTAGGQAESAPAHARVFYPARLMALALLALLLAEWGMYHREKY